MQIMSTTEKNNGCYFNVHFFRFSQQEIDAKVTSFRNLMLVRQATVNVAAVAAAGANPAAAAAFMANNAALIAALNAAVPFVGGHHPLQHHPGLPQNHPLANFAQKPSNALLNLRLNQQLHQQRLANALLNNIVPDSSTYR